MCFINRVFSIDVSQTEERIVSLLHQRNLMYAGMSSKYGVFIKIVSVSWLPANMILWNEKSVKTVFGLYNWIKVLENFELFIFYFQV